MMRRRIPFAAALVFFVYACCPRPPGPEHITGVVTDASGGVLPGVTVEAASPALIEKVRDCRHG